MTFAGLRAAIPIACAAAACGAAPAAAATQQCVAPPGTAAVEQYCETIPTVSGAHPSAGGGVASTEAVRPVPARTLRQLNRRGADGRQMIRVLEGPEAAARTPTASSAKATATAAPERPRAAVRARTVAPSTGNPLSAVSAAVAGGTTVGDDFPAVLLLIGAVVGGAASLRQLRRRR